MIECDNCGQYSDWIGRESEWRQVTVGGGEGTLLECTVCGNHQHKR